MIGQRTARAVGVATTHGEWFETKTDLQELRLTRILRGCTGVALLSVLFFGLVYAPPSQRGTDLRPRTGGDLELFSSVVAHLQAGTPYYVAMGSELRARGYPAASAMNWRTPLLLSTVAALRIPLARLVFGIFALIVLVAGIWAFAPRGNDATAWGAFCLAGAAIPVVLVHGCSPFLRGVVWAVDRSCRWRSTHDSDGLGRPCAGCSQCSCASWRHRMCSYAAWQLLLLVDEKKASSGSWEASRTSSTMRSTRRPRTPRWRQVTLLTPTVGFAGRAWRSSSRPRSGTHGHCSHRACCCRSSSRAASRLRRRRQRQCNSDSGYSPTSPRSQSSANRSTPTGAWLPHRYGHLGSLTARTASGRIVNVPRADSGRYGCTNRPLAGGCVRQETG